MSPAVAGLNDRLALAALLVPLAGAALIGALAERRRGPRELTAVATTLFTAAIALYLTKPVASGGDVSFIAWQVGPSLHLSFAVDRLGLLFAVVAATLWLAATIYSRGYLVQSPDQRRYYAFWVVSLGVTLGVAWAANLFTLYVFYELLTFTTYPLVIQAGGAAAARAGRNYIAYSLSGAALVLVAITGVLMLGGDLGFMPGGPLAAGVGGGPGLSLVAGCLLAGFGVKAALVPLHGWLPGAMVAPTPVSALLHAVAVVKSGVFGILRVLFFVIGAGPAARAGFDLPLIWLAGASILLAALAALRQDVLKRRLAYSTISHLAYISLGAATLNGAGIAGALLHLVMHAVLKVTLFFCAGIFITQTGRTRISELDGIGRVLPWTMGAFTVASLGLIGIAPVGGFVSKWYLIGGGLAGGGPGVVTVLFLSSLLNAAYLLPIVTRAYFRRPDPAALRGRRARSTGPEAPWSMLGPALALAGLAIILGLWPGLPLALIGALVGEL